MLAQQRTHQLPVANIAAHKRVARIALERRKIRGIARVGQQVEIHHRPASAISSSHKTKFEPMNPAPPVTRIVSFVRPI